MKAAAVAAERGHDVTLFESSGQLGGQAQVAQLLPGRSEFGGIVANLEREMTRSGVDIRLGTEVNMVLIEREQPDAVIVATGAQPAPPVLDGMDEAHIVEAWRGDMYVAGDCLSPRTVEEAVLEGLKAGVAV